MNTVSAECRTVQEWRQRSKRQMRPVPAELASHVSECSLCRAAVYTMLATLLPTPVQPISCDTCEEQLGDFIELERSNARQAMQRYPEIWQHLWFCGDCAETYTLMEETFQEDPVFFAPPIPTFAPVLHEQSVNESPLMFYQLIKLERNYLYMLPRSDQWSSLYKSKATAKQYLLLQTSVVGDSQVRRIEAAPDSVDRWSLKVFLPATKMMSLRLTVGSYQDIAVADLHGIVIFNDIPTIDMLSLSEPLVLDAITLLPRPIIQQLGNK